MRPTTKLLLDLTWKTYNDALARYRKQVATGTEETVRYARDIVIDRRKDLERVQRAAAVEDFL